MGCDRWPIDLEPAVEAAYPPVVLLASMMPHLDSPLAALCCALSPDLKQFP